MTEDEIYKVGQAVFEQVMQEFDELKLTCRGKGNIPYIVTNEKQAYAIAKNMASRAEERAAASNITRPSTPVPSL